MQSKSNWLKNTLTRIPLPWLLWKPKTASLAGDQSEMKASDGLKSWNIYTSCRELMLDRFIEISADGNLFLLDKSIDPKNENSVSKVPPHVLVATWSEINIEYASLMDNGKQKRLLTDGVDSEVKQLELDIILSTVRVLNETYDSGLVDILKGYGYRFKYDPRNAEQYHKDLARVISLSNKRKIDIIEKERELQRLSGEENVKIKNEKDGWTEILVALSDDVGYPLRADAITVYEFTVRHKNLVKKLKTREKEASKMAHLPTKHA